MKLGSFINLFRPLLLSDENKIHGKQNTEPKNLLQARKILIKMRNDLKPSKNDLKRPKTI